MLRANKTKRLFLYTMDYIPYFESTKNTHLFKFFLVPIKLGLKNRILGLDLLNHLNL